MSRKYEAIDLMKLYTLGSANGWNQELTKLYEKHDINGLAKLLYRIQAGMTDLAKKKLNTEEIDVWFARLTRSIEKTAKQIIKDQNPMPGDAKAIDLSMGKALHQEMRHDRVRYHKDPLEAKRARDQALADFLRRSSF